MTVAVTSSGESVHSTVENESRPHEVDDSTSDAYSSVSDGVLVKAYERERVGLSVYVRA